MLLKQTIANWMLTACCYDAQVWGAAEMVLGYELRASQRVTMLRVLRANTMLVRGHRSFSHDEFRRVVYAKYIRTPDQHVLLHTLMVSKLSRKQCTTAIMRIS
jgi:hypothetical protein